MFVVWDVAAPSSVLIVISLVVKAAKGLYENKVYLNPPFDKSLSFA